MYDHTNLHSKNMYTHTCTPKHTYTHTYTRAHRQLERVKAERDLVALTRQQEELKALLSSISKE